MISRVTTETRRREGRRGRSFTTKDTKGTKILWALREQSLFVSLVSFVVRASHDLAVRHGDREDTGKRRKKFHHEGHEEHEGLFGRFAAVILLRVLRVLRGETSASFLLGA